MATQRGGFLIYDYNNTLDELICAHVNLQVQEHGQCYKRTYLEKHLEHILEQYVASQDDINYQKLLPDVAASKAHVHTLKLTQLPSHLDLYDVLSDFPHLNSLSFKFG